MKQLTIKKVNSISVNLNNGYELVVEYRPSSLNKYLVDLWINDAEIENETGNTRTGIRKLIWWNEPLPGTPETIETNILSILRELLNQHLLTPHIQTYEKELQAICNLYC